MTEEHYNGWKNRETWALMLHINNDEGLIRDALEITLDAFNKEIESLNETDSAMFGRVRIGAICQARDAFQEWAEVLLTVDGYAEQYGGDIPMDMVRIAQDVGSLWRVDFYECAESLLEDRLREFDLELEVSE